MSEIIKKYKLLKDLPMYPAGTIIVNKYQELPSQYNTGSYFTDGEWYVDGGLNARPTLYLEHLVKWCTSSRRNDDNHDDWVEKLNG